MQICCFAKRCRCCFTLQSMSSLYISLLELLNSQINQAVFSQVCFFQCTKEDEWREQLQRPIKNSSFFPKQNHYYLVQCICIFVKLADFFVSFGAHLKKYAICEWKYYGMITILFNYKKKQPEENFLKSNHYGRNWQKILYLNF